MQKTAARLATRGGGLCFIQAALFFFERREHFAGVHYAERVEGFFDSAQHFKLRWRFVFEQDVLLYVADSVLAAADAAERYASRMSALKNSSA